MNMFYIIRLCNLWKSAVDLHVGNTVDYSLF